MEDLDLALAGAQEVAEVGKMEIDRDDLTIIP